MRRPGRNWRNAGAGIGLVLLPACGGARTPESTTTGVTAASLAPPPPPIVVAPAVPPPAPAPPAWTVRPRFEFDGGPDLFQETHCLPDVASVLPLDDGSAWVFGSCGLRLRIATDGAVTDFSASWQPLFLGFALSPVCCAGLPGFGSPAMRAPNDVLVAAGTSCDMDPSSVTRLPLERFDGSSWTPTGGLFYLDPHEGGIDALVWGGATLYALAQGNSESDFQCSVGRFDGKRWTPLRKCARAKGVQERFNALAVDPQGRPWGAGSRMAEDYTTTGFIAVYDGKRWTEEAPPVTEPLALSIAADGTVWVCGDEALARRTAPGTFEAVPLPDGSLCTSILARSSSEAWIGGHQDLVHIEGTRSESLRLKAKDDGRLLTVSAAGDRLWAHDGDTVWDVSRSAPAVPPVLHEPRGVTASEIERLQSPQVWNARDCKARKAKASR